MSDRKHEFIITVDRDTRDKVIAAARKRQEKTGERLSDSIDEIYNEAMTATLREDAE